MAVVPMFIGYICFGYGLERVRASTAIAISLLEPVVAALLAAAVLGERLSLPAYAGIALIFASLALFTFTGKNPDKEKPRNIQFRGLSCLTGSGL